MGACVNGKHPVARRFSHVQGEWAIARLPPDAPIPAWACTAAPGFSSVTRTDEELSVVCRAEHVPAGVRVKRDWALLSVQGPFAFEETGVIASFVQPLSEAGIAVFVISTFDTDYVLVASACVVQACRVLVDCGHVHM